MYDLLKVLADLEPQVLTFVKAKRLRARSLAFFKCPQA